MIKQRTLKNTIKATGVGVHTGQKVKLVLSPAPVNTGIVFRRSDLSPVVEIPAHPDYVGETALSTSLCKDNVKIYTIEHLMAAFSGLGIDNAYVNVDASEIPIMDGSASPFVFLIQSAGIEEQNAFKKFIKIKEKIEIHNGDKYACLEPYDGFKINFGINFDHPAFKEDLQNLEIDFADNSFVKEISRARTFGFMSEYEAMRARNLARGASLDNAVVLNDYTVVNDGGLRYNNEFVKHKVLDVIGDLYLLGYSILGHFSGYKSGHALNNQLLNKLLLNQQAWEFIDFSKESDRKSDFRLPSFATYTEVLA
ncbi:MAG: UDP-3-O-acyl-N-acetylglucosamine deacetylase [Gammaproteobacteria bacterium]|nr:UDP-3-O-acyl-N-acetylglucosamine deacetylase [Gammaproteobacteria bacterium]